MLGGLWLLVVAGCVVWLCVCVCYSGGVTAMLCDLVSLIVLISLILCLYAWLLFDSLFALVAGCVVYWLDVLRYYG